MARQKKKNQVGSRLWAGALVSSPKATVMALLPWLPCIMPSPEPIIMLLPLLVTTALLTRGTRELANPVRWDEIMVTGG